jgi:hypothetical protein
MLWASLLSLVGAQAKFVPLDFGYGVIHLDKKFRFRADQTDREPTHLRFHFTLVNDTHLNGQTSYAEELTLSVPAQPCRFPLKASSAVQTLTEGSIEFQYAMAQYDRDPVHEAVIVGCLTNHAKSRTLSWYGFAKRYKAEAAKEYLMRIDASLEVDPISEAKWEEYRAWAANGWMEANFANKPKLIAALERQGFDLPYQPYIGALSTWQRKDGASVAIDGERPAHLHFVQAASTNPTTTLRFEAGRWRQSGSVQISADLLPEFAEKLDKTRTHNFRVCRFNLWQPLPQEGNAILTWLEQCRKE